MVRGSGLWCFRIFISKSKKKVNNESSASKSHGKAVGLYKFKNTSTNRPQSTTTLIHRFFYFLYFLFFSSTSSIFLRAKVTAKRPAAQLNVQAGRGGLPPLRCPLQLFRYSNPSKKKLRKNQKSSASTSDGKAASRTTECAS